MQFLFFALSVGFIFFIDYMTKAIGKTNLANFNKRFIRLLQFVKFAPIIALFVLLALVLTYFHQKKGYACHMPGMLRNFGHIQPSFTAPL